MSKLNWLLLFCPLAIGLEVLTHDRHLLLRLDKLSYGTHMIAYRFPQRGMFDVKTPRSVGVGGEAH